MAAQIDVTLGGWFQRTTLHLTEIYDFFSTGKSGLTLDLKKLDSYWKRLELVKVTREAGYLEYVLATTKNGITIKYYEDGLYTLHLKSRNVSKDKMILEEYLNSNFNPAVNYIFSLGAPTPKILANIKTTHPVVVSLPENIEGKFVIHEELYGKVYSELMSTDFCVQKTPLYIFVTYKQGKLGLADQIIGTQIFFREFKDHLEKYLNIHRRIWEEISEIKERKDIRGTEVEALRAKLSRYQKTISLISNRINQMGTYVKTRQSISKNSGVEKELIELFNFKFETLVDTLDYIKELWKMTAEYLISTIQVLAEIRAQTTNRTIQSLTLITTLGVVSTLIGYLSKDSFPVVKTYGLAYMLGLLAAGLVLNLVLQKVYQHKKYKLTLAEHDKNI